MQRIPVMFGVSSILKSHSLQNGGPIAAIHMLMAHVGGSWLAAVCRRKSLGKRMPPSTGKPMKDLVKIFTRTLHDIENIREFKEDIMGYNPMLIIVKWWPYLEKDIIHKSTNASYGLCYPDPQNYKIYQPPWPRITCTTIKHKLPGIFPFKRNKQP